VISEHIGGEHQEGWLNGTLLFGQAQTVPATW
jgi:hypothetical protein